MLEKKIYPLIAILKPSVLICLLTLPSLFFGQAPSQTSTITLEEVTLQAPKLKTSRLLIPASVS